MLLKRIGLFAPLLFLIASCSSSVETTETKNYLSSFLNNNDKIVAFGNASLKSILNKTDYQSEDKLATLLTPEMLKLDRVLDMNSPFYFAAEAPLDIDSPQDKFFLFFKVKNADSLAIELTSRGYDMNKTRDISYTEDGDFVLGIREDLAIAVIQGGDYDAADVVKSAFAKTEGAVSGGKIDELLDEKGDIVISLNVDNLYGTSNTDRSKLSEAEQKELENLIADAYIQTVFKFEDGAAIVETKNHFSDELKQQLFFKSDNTSAIVNKLNNGNGQMIAGVAINLDVEKMEAFYNKFSPETMEGIMEEINLPSAMLSLIGFENILSKLVKGQMGVSVIGNVDEYSLGVNAFFGASDMGKRLFSLGRETMGIPALNYEIKEDGIYGSYAVMGELDDSKNASKLELPTGCEDFGKKGISAFVSFEGISLEEFGLSGEQKLIEIVNYATFEYDENGGKLYVKAKKGQENVLKQVMDVLIEELSDQLGGVVL